LIKESAMDKPIVVEGKKDKVAIQEMGIKGKINFENRWEILPANN
jgi:5S rRNA maturation endonuclease (ribonuclease M5)